MKLVEEWVKPKDKTVRKRDEYLKEITKYQKIYEEVFKTIPFFVRCNMI